MRTSSQGRRRAGLEVKLELKLELVDVNVWGIKVWSEQLDLSTLVLEFLL